MTVLQIVFYLLKISNTVLSWAYQQKFYNEGMDAAIAKEAASILQQSKFAKDILDEISGLDESDVDARLRDLEPKDGPN